ncbi:Helix-turn-helix [Megasphaera elsdenii]|uniref:helix-turn-helix domain-containing protein n=1 Tax=Megasphaera elsdenii TaxID=907 RepID=UPI0008E976B1|nr:helix-turn-helix transcriptional regulator [Megasphaera elsdenii]SFH79975.1 Helix-turn-helix [Megasphaera elsdenii]
MDAIDNKQIGLRIAQARRDKNMTGKELALRVGVAASTILRYEKGQITKIKIPIIEAIARVLDINPMWLIGKSKHKSVKEMLTANNISIKNQNLTLEENQLLTSFRKLSTEDKRMLLEYSEFLLSKKYNGYQESDSLVAEQQSSYDDKKTNL